MSHGHLAPRARTRQGLGRPAPCTAAPPWLWPLSASRPSSAPASRAETKVTGLGSKIVKAKSRCPRVAWSLCAVNTIRDLLLAWVTQRLVGSPQSKTLLLPAPRHTHCAPDRIAAHSPQLSGGRLLSLPGSEGPRCRVEALWGRGREGAECRAHSSFFVAPHPRQGLV